MLASLRLTDPAAAGSARPPAPDLPAAVEHDRRAGTERIIELGRWLVLIIAAVSANVLGADLPNRPSINLVLGTWALFNLVVTLTLVAHRLPGRRTQYAMTALDIAVASTLVYLSGGFASSFGLTFYAVIVASSLRFGLGGSLVCAAIVVAANLGVGWAVAGTLGRHDLEVYAAYSFLYFVIALTSGLLARELIRARARQMTRTFELEHAAFFELRQIDRMKSDFIMLASHELRTPLAKIRNWLSLIHEAGDRLPPAAHAEGLEVLRSETEHLARLTDNLLCISQLEAGEMRLRTAAVDLWAVVESVLERFVEQADRGRFQVDMPGEARPILADRDRLVLVLACLVDNALKFSPGTEPVRIAAARAGDEVRIEVVDNGRRIPDDQLDHVFASFYQVETPLTRQRGGSGIGLYLARQLVERMSGRIGIDNRRARGNTFVVTLPADV